MYDRWESDPASDYQIKYIKGLMGSKERYILRIDLENISKGQASNLIQALQKHTDEDLITEKILKLKSVCLTKGEPVENIKDENKNVLSPVE